MISPVESLMSSSGDVHQSPHGGNSYDNIESNGSKSPLHMNLGFLRNLTEKKTTRGTSLPNTAFVTLTTSRWAATKEERT